MQTNCSVFADVVAVVAPVVVAAVVPLFALLIIAVVLLSISVSLWPQLT